MNHSAFHFWMPVEIHCAAGAAADLSDAVAGDRILIVCDPFLYENGTAQRIGDTLNGCQVHYFHGIEPNPSTDRVDECAALARSVNASTVIGVGGGSCLDTAKAVACLAGAEGSICEYYADGGRSFGPRTVRLILIPTTAGTGSEVTNVGVFTNSRTHTKLPLVCRGFWADLAVVDPTLTYSLPAAQTASTGMDAFCHAIEAYWNRESQPLCDYLAIGAMRDILKYIQTACEEPENETARGAMLTAALTAGVAFSQTRTTGVHAVSFPLTTGFHASHGVACAITLPAFIRISTEQAAEKMQRLARMLDCADVSALADRVEGLMKTIGLPTRLSELGVQERDLPQIAKDGMAAAAQMQLTPATMTAETVCQLLRSILS